MKIKFLISLLIVSFIGLIFYSGCNTAEEGEEDEGDYTVNWTEPVKLCSFKGFSGFVNVAVNGSNVHVFWVQDNTFKDTDYPSHNSDIYYRRSTDNGENWNEAKRITWTSHRKNYISLDINENNIHLLTNDYAKFMYIKSIDNGDSWKTRSFYSSGSATIEENNHNIHVIYKTTGYMDEAIYYLKSEDNGDTWDNKKRLSPNNWTQCWHATLAVNDNKLYTVYEWVKNQEIYYQSSVDNGDSWTNHKLIFSLGDHASGLCIGAYENNIHVMWNSGYRRSIDNGETWETKVGGCQKFLVKENEIHRIPPPSLPFGSAGLTYCISADNGDSWTGWEVFHADGMYWINKPSFAVEGNYIHLVWTKLPYKEENYSYWPLWVDTEIYYMRGEYEKK